jgi:hypothetical protein
VVVVDLPTLLVEQALLLVPRFNDVLLGEGHEDGCACRDVGLKLDDGSWHVEKGQGEGVEALAAEAWAGDGQVESDWEVVGVDACSRGDVAGSAEEAEERGRGEEAVKTSSGVVGMGEMGDVAEVLVLLAPDVGQLELLHDVAELFRASQTGVVGRGATGEVGAVMWAQNAVGVACNEEGTAGGEVVGEDASVEGAALGGVGGGVDVDE